MGTPLNLVLSSGGMWGAWSLLLAYTFASASGTENPAHKESDADIAEIDALLSFTSFANFPRLPKDPEDVKKDEVPDLLKRKSPKINFDIPDAIRDDDEDMKIEAEDRHAIEPIGGGAGGRFFRGKAGGEQRGSLKNANIKVKPLPHGPAKDDPPGCGNPICVVLDQKPRRFASLCKFVCWLKEQQRGEQVNYIQKGDCYDIIDNEGKNSLTKPWTNEIEDNECEQCKQDQYCKEPVTFNIDLQSILKGESSAQGGRDEERLVGIPVEFPNMCEAMRYFQKKKNINFKSQYIGMGLGKKSVLFPNEGDRCLWSEWFDFESPCLATGEKELYNMARSLMNEQATGPMRICEMNSVVQTEFAGGSEIKLVPAKTAQMGNAVGTSNIEFKQNIETTMFKLRCQNDQNKGVNIPGPYAYPKDKNTTCLDYKARYCCKSTDIYRPYLLNEFNQHIKRIFPIGATRIEVKLTDGLLNDVTMHITNPIDEMSVTVVKMKFIYAGINREKVTISMSRQRQDGVLMRTITCEGHFKRVDSGPNKHIQIYNVTYTSGAILLKIDTQNSENPRVIDCIIESKETEVIAKVEYYEGDSTSQSGSKNPIKLIKLAREIVWTTTITSGGKSPFVIKIDELGKILEATGDIPTYVSEKENMLKQVSQLNVELQFDYFIESPPLSELFAECEWKDYINTYYPGKEKGSVYEFELKEDANKGQFKLHVCGHSKSNSYYIDAVTMEDQIPWYELKLGDDPAKQEIHETLKLSPYWGYACNDVNQVFNGTLCQDMKVRYCCAKQRRATWAPWGPWADCSVTCGGGTATRTRKCERSMDVDEHMAPCFGADDANVNKDLYYKQKRECNVAGCPQAATFTCWSLWSKCTQSCGSGRKKRERRCLAARNGGKKCPEKFLKEENIINPLFEQIETCSEADCIVPEWTAWSQFSACSATCGVATKLRTRGCRKARNFQKLPIEMCGGEAESKDTMRCHNRGCPVAGGWSDWTGWQPCSQKCIYEPDSKQPGAQEHNSKAQQIRHRSCTSPLPQFGGKKCEENKENKYDRKHKAESQTRACAVDNMDVQYCPEDCIFTEWSSWSACSSTCMKMEWVFIPEGDTSKNPKPIKPNPLPLRNRIRILVKMEKNGGTCKARGRGATFKNDTSNGGFGYQVETNECPCCLRENGKSQMVGDIYEENFLIPYNPKDKLGCLPMCPVSCQWGKWTDTYNCENMEDLKKDSAYNAEHNCIILERNVADKFARFEKEFKKFEEYVQNKDIKDFNDLPKDFQIILERKLKIRLPERKFNNLQYNYMRIARKEGVKTTIGKHIDPAFGGTACIMEEEFGNVTLTRIRELFENDYEKYTERLLAEKTHYYACDVSLCQPKYLKIGHAQSFTCEAPSWTLWGPWGSCNMQCGSKGKRKRTRKCTPCADPKKAHVENPPEGRCKPTLTFDGSIGLTSEDFAECSPCPSDKLIGWADWEEWTAPDKTCGIGKQYRIRKCNDDYAAASDLEDSKRCKKKYERGGVEREEKTTNIPCGLK